MSSLKKEYRIGFEEKCGESNKYYKLYNESLSDINDLKQLLHTYLQNEKNYQKTIHDLNIVFSRQNHLIKQTQNQKNQLIINKTKHRNTNILLFFLKFYLAF